MRRSICSCEPTYVQAGEVSTWKFSYTTASVLPKGTKLKFDLISKGRQIDWEAPQIKGKDNSIWLELPGGKLLSAKEVAAEEGSTPAFEFVLPSEVKTGDTFIIAIGTTNLEEKKQQGNRAQTYVQRRKAFNLYIDPKGKGDYKEPEIFTLDIRGGVLSNIRVIAPSIVARNQRFDIIVRFEDLHGNLTANAKEGTLIELSYEHLRENLSWKLFVPETGFINIPNLYFNEPGIYRIQLKNLDNGQKFHSFPIKCLSESNKNLFWGLLHGESEKFDAVDNLENCLRHFRDEKAYHFYGVSPFESVEEVSNDEWKTIMHQVAEFDEDGRFVTFLGFQWEGEPKEEGVRQFVYSKDAKPIMRKKDAKSSHLPKIYKSSNPKEFLSIPCMSMAKGHETDFANFTPEFEKVVEIYNAWGSSECKDDNLCPIKNKGKGGFALSNGGSIRDALNAGHRFGFIAGGLDDRGLYQPLYESDQVQYSPGLTAIFAEEQTRESIFQALYHRECYATTGPRIILGFHIAGASIGQELNTKAKPGLIFNRHITGYAASSAPIEKIEIIRNGKIIETFKPMVNTFEFAFDDSDLLENCVLQPNKEQIPFIYYYMRVTQDDGHIAWGSPIWIDHTEPCIATTSPKKVVVKKTKKG